MTAVVKGAKRALAKTPDLLPVLKDGGKGIKIDEVVKGSPAAQAGLQKDDVIIGVNRDRVNSIAEMRKVLAAKPAIIALQIVRGNESIYLLMR